MRPLIGGQGRREVTAFRQATRFFIQAHADDIDQAGIFGRACLASLRSMQRANQHSADDPGRSDAMTSLQARS